MDIAQFFTSLFSIINEMSPYVLLGFVIAGFLHAFVKPQLLSRHLSGNGVAPIIKAALFGIPLPLCSCGVLPTAVSLRRQGASKGAVISFLIATPQTGVDSIAATYSLLGLPFAILRPLGALLGAMLGGIGVRNLADEDSSNNELCVQEAEKNRDNQSKSFGIKCVEAIRYGLVDMIGNVGKWLIIGLVVAALITVLVPSEIFLGLSDFPILAMLLMVVVSVPMYVCATGSIPIALSLIAKGLTPGVGFVLLMAGPAANFASMMILSKFIGKRCTVIYVASVVITSIIFGLIIDYIMPREWFMSAISDYATSCNHSKFGVFESLCSVVLIGLLFYTTLKNNQSYHKHQNLIDSKTDNMKHVFNVDGMACAHCSAAVRNAVLKIEGAKAVSVDYITGSLIVEGDVSVKDIRDAVSAAGFTVKS